MNEDQIKKDIQELLAARRPKKTPKTNHWYTLAVSLVVASFVQLINSIPTSNIFNHQEKYITASLEQNTSQNKILTIKSWNEISNKQKALIRAEVFSLFPTIFLRRRGQNKWGPIQIYLIETYRVSHTNIRDIFRTAHGNWPEFEGQAIIDKHHIKNYLSTTPKSQLIIAWGEKIPNSKFETWVSIVKKHIDKSLGPEMADLFAHEMFTDRKTKEQSN